jgi:hypothetical protein
MATLEARYIQADQLKTTERPLPSDLPPYASVIVFRPFPSFKRNERYNAVVLTSIQDVLQVCMCGSAIR